MARYRSHYTRLKVRTSVESVYEGYFLEYAIQFLRMTEAQTLQSVLRFCFERLQWSEMEGLFSELLALLQAEVREQFPTERPRTGWASETLEGQIRAYIDDFTEQADDAANFVTHRLSGTYPKGYRYIVRKLLGLLYAKREAYQKRSIRKKPSGLKVFEDRLKEVALAFNLNQAEAKILTFYYLLDCDDSLNVIAETRHFQLKTRRRQIETFHRLLEISKPAARRALASTGSLFSTELIKQGDYSDHHAEIHPLMADYFTGFSSIALMNQFFEVKEDLENGLEPKDFLVPEKNFEMLELLLKAGGRGKVNLLLHGTPGTGKTESAITAARRLGYQLYFLKVPENRDTKSPISQRAMLVAAQNLLRREKTILVVDECDALLNTQRDSREKTNIDPKAWLNQYLDSSKLKIIWITNSAEDIDPSHTRRFSYIQNFPKPRELQRLKAWKLQVARQKVDFLTDAEIADLAKRYELSPGVIAQALRDVQRIRSTRKSSNSLEQLKNILAQQQKFQNGAEVPQIKDTPGYDLDGLNTDTCLETLRGNVARFLKLREASERDLPFPNLNILLFGSPGTGKTEFARQMAMSLGSELIVKRASDLLSMYVGGTEQNLAKAFHEAQERKAILFLDEADSFFIRREAAVRSWEVSQTNEILTQMENFSGVLICATNFEKNLDPAALRRFSHKVKFQSLMPEANVKFFERILQPLAKAPLKDEDKARLMRLQGLVPGDFRVVYQRHWLSQGVKVEHLISDLEAEAQLRTSLGTKVIRPLGSS